MFCRNEARIRAKSTGRWAKLTAIRTNCSGVSATQSARPALDKRLTATRLACQRPASAIVGTPIQSASQVIVVP